MGQEVITLHWLDFLILAVYLLVMVLVGLYHSSKQDSLEEFFLAKKGMSWIPIGISMMAALNSGMDYINCPSMVINMGWYVLLSNISWFLIYPYVFYIILPMLRRLDLVSIYEFLGLRFGEGVRTLTATIFLLWRLGWMATAIYVPCLALTAATGKPDWLVPSIIIVGCVVTFYTMMGGIKAVIWNDVAQFCIMMTGLTLTVIFVLINVEGGVSAMFHNFFQKGIGNLPDPAIDTSTWWGSMFSYLSIKLVFPMIVIMWFTRMVGFTSDQVMTQRFGTARNLSHARKSFLITAFSDTAWMTMLFIVGLTLATYMLGMGTALPEWIKSNPDRIFPYFMAKFFPIGVAGIVLAAILAASMSSIDSAISSMTTILMVDFYQRFISKRSAAESTDPREQRRQVFLSRVVTVCVGASGVLLAIYADRIGTLFDISNTLLGTFIGSMLGIFWLGMFVKRANLYSTSVGTVVGTLCAASMAFSGQIVKSDFVANWAQNTYHMPFSEIKTGIFPVIYGFSSISSGWIAPVGLFVTLIVGTLLGSSKHNPLAERWNWFAIMRMPLHEGHDHEVAEPVPATVGAGSGKDA